ncbi:MAG TPA: class II aldolase/adducin family protein [bacterium]|nr:class II aldolase/adducin family protein [bacterium]
MLAQFQKIGAELLQFGINASHSGNISVRAGDEIVITRSGSMLSQLGPGDLVTVPLAGEFVGAASRELVVHRAIYRGTSARAILHVHPPYSTMLSLVDDEIIPFDSEAFFFLKAVPVLRTKETIGSPEVADKLPPILARHGKIAVLATHGSFAIGDCLEDTYLWTTTLERAANLIYLTKTFDEGAYRRTRRAMQQKLRG